MRIRPAVSSSRMRLLCAVCPPPLCPRPARRNDSVALSGRRPGREQARRLGIRGGTLGLAAFDYPSDYCTLHVSTSAVRNTRRRCVSHQLRRDTLDRFAEATIFEPLARPDRADPDLLLDRDLGEIAPRGHPYPGRHQAVSAGFRPGPISPCRNSGSVLRRCARITGLMQRGSILSKSTAQLPAVHPPFRSSGPRSLG
jgi:hypothetical protein